MAQEINRPFDVSVPTRDFSIPHLKDMNEGVKKVLKPLALGEPIYVGCMGGIGRTGLFLACLAKTLGEENPVRFVRKNYVSHAIETKDQEYFVQYFDPYELRVDLDKYRMAARIVDILPYAWVKRWTARLLAL
jgi:protein-tyrosine phosphatase